MNRITHQASACTGCRTCEIACSYHHRRVFRPSISSIEVTSPTGDGGLALSFYRSSQNGHLACDKCAGLDEPLCIKYCSLLMQDELRALLEKRDKNEA